MRKPKIDYDTIWDFYKMRSIIYDKNEKNRIQKTIRNRFDREYKDKTWENLTELEKQKFICLDIQDYMLEDRDEDTVKVIRKKIQQQIGDTFHSINTRQNHKEKKNVLYKVYCNVEDTPEMKKLKYGEFCKDMKKYYPKVPIPTFENWIKPLFTCVERPLRIYDCVNEFYNSDDNRSHPRYLSVDNIIIQIIMQYLERYHGLKIDIPLIEECLCFLESCEIDEFEEDDFSLENPQNDVEMEEIISIQFEKYAKYCEMMEKLTPFYKIEK